MKHNKIIFLDVDGVINIPPYQEFNTECMAQLQRIIDATGAKIVVSSSWRDYDTERMKKNFTENGFTEKLWSSVIGITCRGYQHVIKGSKLPIVRGNEIKAWVDTELRYPWHANPEMDIDYRLLNPDGSFKMMRSNQTGKDFTYVILDDDNDMLLEQIKWFIELDGEEGLTWVKAEYAIELLNSVMNDERSVATEAEQRTNP